MFVVEIDWNDPMATNDPNPKFTFDDWQAAVKQIDSIVENNMRAIVYKVEED